jgi:DNA-directed RNA polymerase alpha subunit
MMARKNVTLLKKCLDKATDEQLKQVAIILFDLRSVVLSKPVTEIAWQQHQNRIVHALEAEGINTVGELAQRTLPELSRIMNLGHNSVFEFIDKEDGGLEGAQLQSACVQAGRRPDGMTLSLELSFFPLS